MDGYGFDGGWIRRCVKICFLESVMPKNLFTVKIRYSWQRARSRRGLHTCSHEEEMSRDQVGVVVCLSLRCRQKKKREMLSPLELQEEEDDDHDLEWKRPVNHRHWW